MTSSPINKQFKQRCIHLFIFNKILMSQFMKPKQKEVSIFGKWEIVEPVLRVGKQRVEEKNKSQKVRRAEQVINDAQLLYSNINSFLNEKRQINQKIEEHKKKANLLLDDIYELNNSKNKNLADQDNIVKRIRQILQQLYRVIRQGRALEDYIANYFQNSNLANYDPRIHQLKNTKTYIQVENELLARIKQIERGCSSLFRSLHYIDKLDAVFSKEQSFNYCLLNLQELISHDSLVKIHGLMIRQLNQVEQRKKQLFDINRSVETEYMKYELVYDCLELMKIERQEMINEMRLFQRDFQHVTRYVPIQGRDLLDHNDLMLQETIYRQTMQKIIESQLLAETNLKVYRANIQNFTRVSAQTSLYCYSYRLSQFTEMLTQFERYFANWKVYLTTLRYLYDRRNELMIYRDQQSLKKIFSQSDRQYLIQLYEEVRDRKTGQSKNLQFYQQNVLTDIQRELKQNNIAYTVRQIQPQQVKSMLQKQNQFFQNLSKIHPTSKVYYIKQNKNNINVLIFELQQLMAQGLINHATFQTAIQGYAAALAYCQIIASSVTYQEQLRSFQYILNQGKSYQNMPFSMTQLALSYIHDLNMIIRSQVQKQSLHTIYLQQFGQAIQIQIRQKRKANIQQAVEKNIRIFNQLWLSLYARYYRFMTPIGEELILDELKQIGLLITQRIKVAFQTVKEVVEINANKTQIEKSQFFTYKVLLSLYEMVSQKKTNEQLQKFKISNLHAILQTLFDYIDQKYLEKPSNLQANDIIKTTIAEYILQKIYKHNDYHRIIRTLRLQMYLQNISVLYLEYSQHELVAQNWLHALLKIQTRMKQIGYNSYDMKSKLIVEKLNSILPQIKKYPLALSTKQDISKFLEAFQVCYYVNELEKIYKSGIFGISEAAAALVGLRAIYQSFIFIESHFQTYQNAVVNQKRKISIFFQQLRLNIVKQISKIKERDILHRHFIDAKNPVTLRVGLARLFGLSYD